ncbi:MAG: hypothetical protein NC223_10640, partial [Butyrivibrio sp.]|nr:hypothetical protein [Butyrivibrio sp.]
MKIKEIKSKLKEFDNMELPDRESILKKARAEEGLAAEAAAPPRLRSKLRFVPAAAACLLLACAAVTWISHAKVVQAKNYRNA